MYGPWYEGRCSGVLLVWVISWSVSYLTLVELYFVEIVNVHVHVCISYLWTCIHSLGSSTVTHYKCFSIILQVTLPAEITLRWGHSAVVFGVGDLRVVVLFGGYYINVISETTLLLMCK